MPLTVAHPVAVVPLHRYLKRMIPFSALVVGALVPDFRYLLTFWPGYWNSHSLAGLFQFCLPVGLVTLWAYHTLIKRPLLDLLPDRHYAALAPRTRSFSFLPPRRLAGIVLGILLGAATHILWDGFTHERGVFVEWWPVLETRLVRLGPHSSLHVYSLLQHSSTVVGVVLLAVLYARWLRRQAPDAPMPARRLAPRARARIFLWLFGLSAAMGLWAAWVHTMSRPFGWGYLRSLAFHGAVGWMGGLFLITLLYGAMARCLTPEKH